MRRVVLVSFSRPGDIFVQPSVVFSATDWPDNAIFGEVPVLILAYSEAPSTRWIGSKSLKLSFSLNYVLKRANDIKTISN